jgi:hypothetical protein
VVEQRVVDKKSGAEIRRHHESALFADKRRTNDNYFFTEDQ